MGFAVFNRSPNSESVRAFLGRTIHANQATPKYIISDKGPQFWCSGFKAWCKKRGIKPRFGAVGQHGSVAVVERFIRTLKDECTRCLQFLPYNKQAFRNELRLYLHWFNEHRPHMTLKGRTPNEVYLKKRAANQQPRFEPRKHWPRGSPCAKPQTLVKGHPGVELELQVDFTAGRKHLPVVKLRRAA